MLGIRIERPNNHLVIVFPSGLRLRPYRTGVDIGGVPDFQMSGSKIREILSQKNSISIFEYSAGFSVTSFPVRDLAVVYDGDMREGLRGLWLGASLNIEDLEKTEWLFLESFYARDTSRPDDIDLEDDGDIGMTPVLDPKAPTVRPFTEREPPNVAMGARDAVADSDMVRGAPGDDR